MADPAINHHHPFRRARVGCLLLGVLFCALAGAPGAVAAGTPERVVVVDDKAYPPYAFLDGRGAPRGITIDLWKLWSRRTGIPVEFRLMEWDAALEAVAAGRADAVGGLFRTPEREAHFDFAGRLLTIPTAVFFHRKISGIKGLDDLAGFRVGFVRSDSSEELMRARPGDMDLVAYPGVDALVRDAVEGHIKVFVADTPVARFYLAQMPGGEAFRQSADIQVNVQFAAVREGNDGLRQTLQQGFDLIAPEEIEEVLVAWSGRPAVEHFPWHAAATVLALVVLLAVAVFFWNLLLRRRIASATRDITAKSRELASSHESLRQSEAKFRAIYENAPYSIAINRLADGRFLDVNRAFIETSGYRREEILGMGSRDILGGDAEGRASLLEGLRARGVVRNLEVTTLRRDGSRGLVSCSSTLLEVDGEPQVLTVAADITERILARQALQKSEEKFRTIFNNAPLGIFRTSFDGRLLEANATLARMLGYDSREELLAAVTDLARDIYPTAAERRRLLDALLRRPQGVRREIEFQRRDGTPLYAVINASLLMDAAGRPAFLDGTIEDVTSLRQAEEELRRLAAAVEQSGEIILVTDTRGVIQYVNQAFERITGYSRQEAVGRKPSLIKSGEHDQAYYATLWQTICRGETWTGRLVNRRKDGTRFIEEATISPVLDAVGKIVNFVAAKRDITHELDLEEQSRQMQKMEAIGQLTGGVAHDFNNLLQAINGFTDLAVAELGPGHAARDFLHQARSAGKRAANLVQQLLLFSRRQIMQPRVLDLNGVIADLLKLLGRILGEHIRIDWRPQAGQCVIRADSGMLDQVVMNLCVNARDAMPAGGVLTIATQTVLLGAAFCARHAWARPGRFARLSVTDTGCGIPRETLPRIFEPFFSTKGEGKGTGLGLATSYGIVRQHNGMIHAASAPGEGTVFQVYLPLCAEERATAVAGPAEAAAGGHETILLAEDDQVVRDLAGTILRRGGYTVLAAGDGEAAVELFRRNADRVGMVLLDVVMPRLGGRAALERIRETRPGIPALFASGYSEDAIHTGFVLDAGLSLIQKPYTPNDLLQAVRRVLDQGRDAPDP